MPATTCPVCDAPLAEAGAACAACATATAAPTHDPLELEQLRHALAGDFDVAAPLGRGGMATVYLAHDLTLDRKVAIKVMSRAVLHGGGAERFRREARTAAALSHPNIIPIYSVKQVDDLLFFVMKFVPGRPLDSIIAEVGPLPIPMVQAVLAQVAGALGYAHRQGVVHRDVKPANILIDDEGWAVVTDFGIARVAETTGLTTTGTTVGTPNYMSPEQCLADQPVTGASDQYSLGVLAYEMLTGRTPFAGKSTLAMMYSHVHDAPPPVRDVRPECPPDLAALVERMLAKAPADRYPSLDEAIAAIGTVPLSYDDPTRSQLIALAKTGSQQQLGALLRTPRSPIPVMRKPTPPPSNTAAAPAASASANYARAAVACAAILAAAYFFAPWRAAEPPAAVAVADSTVPQAAVDSVLNGGAPGAPAASVPAATAPAAVPAPGTPPAKPGAAPAAGGARTLAATPAGKPGTAPAAAPVAETPRESPSASVLLDLPDEAAEVAAPATVGAAPFVMGAGAAARRGPDRDAIVRVLNAYAEALAFGDLPTVQRLFPAMPADQLAELSEFTANGGRMKVRWRLQGITEAKGGAAVRVVGIVTELPATGAPSSRSVDATVLMVESKGSWRIRDFPR